MIVNHMIEVAFVIIAMEVCSSLLFFNHKAELLQLNRTQFPSLGIFVSKKVGNRKKTKTTFIISVLKVVYLLGGLIFSKIQLFY